MPDTMLDTIARSLAYDRAENLALARTIPEAVCDQRPAGLPQSPCWIVCHLGLADSRQRASITTGKADHDEAYWHEFGPDSDTTKARQHMNARFGSWHQAIDAAAATHARLTEAIRNADPVKLAQPHPNESIREYFPTLNDGLIYASWHEGNHGGQLRAWIHAARHAGLIA